MNTTRTRPFFCTSERIEALRAEADSWLGTRYAPSGAVKQSGASCHRLSGAVLKGSGFPIPDVPERGVVLKCEYFDSMRSYLDGNPAHFEPVPLDREKLLPGDVLLCRIGIGHTALYIGGSAALAIQVLMKSPTHFISLHIEQNWDYVKGVWRPVEIVPVIDGLEN